MTAKLCPVCRTTLVRQPKGRGKRFCSVACRVAAYRRRQRKLSEKTPKWDGPRGRLRLSRLSAFIQEQEVAAERQARIAWTAEQRRPNPHTPPTAVKDRERPPTAAELDAMTEDQLQALIPRKPEPLSEDWMFRGSKGGKPR